MSETDFKELEKQVKKAKRKANEQAQQLHDLVEERLPEAFEEIPDMAQATYEACQNWREMSDQLAAAKEKQTGE